MNETMRVIMERRSIRKYKSQQVADSELQQILDAALYAPNAMNQQKWHFTVIQNKDMLDKMVDIIKENIINSGNEFFIKRVSTPGYHTFYNAPAVVFITADESAQWVEIDCGLAAENITLAATALNIGTCVITSAGLLFASEKGNALRKELGIPEGYKFVCSVALGYKDCENPAAPPRNKEVINYVK